MSGKAYLLRFLNGWGRRIRTSVMGVRVPGPAARRSPNLNLSE